MTVINIFEGDCGHGEQLNRIESKLDVLIALTIEGDAAIMADLTAITQEVTENGDAVSSAVALLGNLAQQVRDLSTDPAALQALADQLDAQSSELAAAVVANTPAAPVVEEPAPVEAPGDPAV